MSPTFEEMKEKIRSIWYWLELSDKDLIPLQVPATSSPRWIIYYGNYGGPASQNRGDPIDCLDLMTKFHDVSFQQGNASDIALKESVQYLLESGFIVSEGAKSYAQSINTAWFSFASWSWRWVGVWIAVGIAIIASLFAVGLLLNSL